MDSWTIGVDECTGGSCGSGAATVETSGMAEASCGGLSYSWRVSLEETTHTWLGGRSGGAPWYVPNKDGSLKIPGPISTSGYASWLVWMRGRMLSRLEYGLGS